MKRTFFSLKTAVAIVAIAVIGTVFSACSKDDGMFNDIELQSSVQKNGANDAVLKSSRSPLVVGVTYTSILVRHYGGAYPNYVYAQLDFSTNQLSSTVTPTVVSNSSALSVGGLITFFNQKAYRNSSPKGCPGFVVASGYQVANYTASNTSKYGYNDLDDLVLNDVTGLTFESEGSYTLPFLKSTHPASYFYTGTNNLKQSSAYAYYDSNLLIGREYHKECGGTWTTPIWVIKNGDKYWAFCVDKYKNTDNNQNSDFNYKYLGEVE